MQKDWMCDLDNRDFSPKVEMVSNMTCTILLKWYDNVEEVDKKTSLKEKSLDYTLSTNNILQPIQGFCKPLDIRPIPFKMFNVHLRLQVCGL